VIDARSGHQQVVAHEARRSLDALIELTTQIASIPAPTGGEGERARFVAQALQARGYPPEFDSVGNVLARRGDGPGPALVLSAHTDTVFPADTPLHFHRSGGTITGPGIGDNALGVASLLTLLDILDTGRLQTGAPIILLANVGEEGLGNLLGVRAAVDRLRPGIGAFIAVEGHNLGRITTTAVGSERLRVVVRCPGGHAWGGFGQPSAVHILTQIAAEMAGVSVPAQPRTSFNIGLIRGGTSINTIASEASCDIDLRSVDQRVLADLTARIRSIAYRHRRSGVEVTAEELGSRPAGHQDANHPMITTIGSALRSLAVEPVFDASSTDANYPLSLGIPSTCIGITLGGRSHTSEEFIRLAPIETGLRQLVSITLAVGRQLGGWRG
jgi:acetylornithine deacetylase/succinyl-diaminopimelate desuccinylase-like protein